MTAQEAQWLNRIIHTEDLQVLFQPIVDASQQAIYGYEALVRGPRSSPLYSPLRLFEVATQAGLLVELDLLCRRLAIRRFAELELPSLLFLNVMPLTILERDFREGLTLGFIRESGLPPERVVIELTEHVPIHDYQLMRQAVDHYRDMGFQVALDDLGAGHSSLRHWSELRPDFVKLDRHFISGIDQEPAKREFLRSILDVARSLDCQLIAEGVETAAEHLCLWELDRGLALLQGFYFARPSAEPPLQLHMRLPAAKPLANPAGRTARSICQAIEAVTPSCAVLTLAERFRQQSSLRCVAVVDDGRPVAVVRRNAFLTLFTNPYSHALYAKRCVLDVADTKSLITNASTPLDILSQQLTDSRDIEQEDFVIVDENSHYLGMGNIVDLLREITAIQVRQARHANPLTGLPGNILINETLGRYLNAGEGVAAAYVDLDNFKAFNDAYGYARGDHMIIALSRLLEAQADSVGGFIGHIGGDDFMLLLPLAHWEKACQQILHHMELMAPGFYEEDDRKRGGIHIENRQGTISFFPFVSVSIAVKPIPPVADCKALDVAAELSELKQQAKKIPGNSLFVERRSRNAASLKA
ncbi:MULTISPECIES: bifunctional diguanylate cyclase/phosphodiesterase [Halomonadaceae]|jgi:diguanylate cyclase (GGDEF)-like protein|uniref:EAL and GGDEF domain-containing protein n=1 Tax=Vreelandella janggokensis TaxID=370767 RepID=A0ABT4IX31_9GAMM|nr:MULTISPECIES: bifunctional diguanylate cyclase/phosphodiesterase [Halomonas]MCZ0928241.1 EAL and GGDEF domain-containing protein [Halomonas janggokensis]QPL46494.1 EAL and GGDEF domain-containing protein [Halomonas sp. A40-4]